MKSDANQNENWVKNFILIFLWLLLVSGLSYAYFSIVFEKNKENTKAIVNAGKLDINFETSEYISNNNAWLVNDTDIFTSADKVIFTVSRNENSTVDKIFYNIYIDDLVISDNLKNADVKWRLYRELNPTESSSYIAEGNFELIGNETTIQLNQAKIFLPENEIHEYTLYMWFSNDNDENQLNLLNGAISCRIKILAVSE